MSSPPGMRPTCTRANHRSAGSDGHALHRHVCNCDVTRNYFRVPNIVRSVRPLVRLCDYDAFVENAPFFSRFSYRQYHFAFLPAFLHLCARAFYHTHTHARTQVVNILNNCVGPPIHHHHHPLWYPGSSVLLRASENCVCARGAGKEKHTKLSLVEPLRARCVHKSDVQVGEGRETRTSGRNITAHIRVASQWSRNSERSDKRARRVGKRICQIERDWKRLIPCVVTVSA